MKTVNNVITLAASLIIVLLVTRNISGLQASSVNLFIIEIVLICNIITKTKSIMSIEPTTNQEKSGLFTIVPMKGIDPLTTASIQALIIKIYACRVVMIPRKFALNLTRK